jgi:AraC-like DNA-binding protein
MSQTGKRQPILRALTAWLAEPLPQRVVRVLEGKRPVNDRLSYFKEVPRLVIGLKGIGRYLLIEQGEETFIHLAPRQTLYLAPCTWSSPLPEEPYHSLAIKFRPDSTRVTIYSRKAMKRDRSIPCRYLADWQTPSGIGARGELLLRLLDDATPPATGERMHGSVVGFLIAEVAGLVKSAPEASGSNQTLLWTSLCDYISNHWSDPMLSRENVARYFHCHPNHISRFFHKQTKQNFRGYLNEIRLKRSLPLLQNLRYNVTDVSILCGYADLQYFIRCFRRRFGITPGEYRKRREY